MAKVSFTRNDCRGYLPDVTGKGIAASVFEADEAITSVTVEERAGVVVVRTKPPLMGEAATHVRSLVESAGGIRLVIEADN
jgi:hypothetical protein